MNLISSSEDEIEEVSIGSAANATTTMSKIILSYTCCDGTGVQLRSKDVARLKDGSMLNDALIDFYFLHLRDKLVRDFPEVSKRAYIFSSYFYEKLTEGRYNFDNVKNWTKNVRIHDFDVLVVPVNGGLHWSLALVFLGSQYYTIMHLDALKMHNHNRISRNLKRYLADAFRHERGKATTTTTPRNVTNNAVVDIEAEEDTLMVIQKCQSAAAFSVDVPTQPNFTDCGMYVCAYASNFFREWSSSSDANQGLRKLVQALLSRKKKMWFDQSDVESMRRAIKSKINHLINQKAAGSEGGNASSGHESPLVSAAPLVGGERAPAEASQDTAVSSLDSPVGIGP